MIPRPYQPPEVLTLVGLHPAGPNGYYAVLQYKHGGQQKVLIGGYAVALGWDRLRTAIRNTTDRRIDMIPPPGVRSPMDLLPSGNS
jgi:hypothetical protein